MTIPRLELRGICKNLSESFSLSDISLNVYPGEVHAIIGENGSGKSTVVKVISGLLKPDSGEILINGNSVTADSINSAKKLGIHCVWQDTNIYPNLTVAENVYIDSISMQSRFFSKVNKYKIFYDCSNVFKGLGLNIDPQAIAGKLGFAQRQLVEMVKAYISNSEIVIFDEPSAAFTSSEKEVLFRIITTLKQRNTAIFYITHLIDEIEYIADRFTVMYQGRIIGTQNVEGTSKEDIVRMLSVPKDRKRYPKINIPTGNVVMSVRDLSSSGILSSISFDLRKSEILGITGLMGSGRTMLANCLFGLTKISTGSIEIDGKRQVINNPDDAIRNGIALLPEDRSVRSIFKCLSLQDNVTISSLKRFELHKHLDNRIMSQVANSYIKKLSIRPGHLNDILESYSGGNQQKVAIARWIMSKSRIYILDEPTRGVDVASKTDVYNAMLDLVIKGASIILISSDIEEILGMCDRVLVLAEGRITGEFKRKDATRENIMYKATTRSF